MGDLEASNPAPRESADLQGRTTSASLLRRARDGEPSAMNALFERHEPPLRRWAHGRLPRWVRTVADTADLVQDAILNTLRRLRDFEPQGHRAIQGYLRRAVDNRIKDEFRRVSRRGVTTPISDDSPDSAPSPFDEASAADLEARYRNALTRLRDSDRRLVVGRVELGYSLDQLAAMNGGKRVDTVRIALSRALDKLATEMARDRS